jgi:uncharacterized protein (TIGR02391 family)
MPNALQAFESIVRAIPAPVAVAAAVEQDHDFDLRNIHPLIEKVSKKLFDDGHYAQATFEAYKFLDNEVQRTAKSTDSGTSLMQKVFSGKPPLIRLTKLSNKSEEDEQDGYRFLFAGSMLAIRNPRGHTVNMADSPSDCLDQLSLASMLLRRLEGRQP